MRPLRGLAAALTITAALFVVAEAQQQDGSIDVAGVKAAIERTLGLAPRGFERLAAPAQAGVRVLGVNVDRVSPTEQRLTIDLSQKALTYDPSGDVELIVDQSIRGLPVPPDD